VERRPDKENIGSFVRDLLTAIAAVVIAVLMAALAVPPLIDWGARRGVIERAISRAAGVEAKTDGRIEVRLLPSPRIRIERLRLGHAEPDASSLLAAFVRTEIALTPLLRGEVRFQETRIGRAEIRVPTGGNGGWELPKDLLSNDSRREWSFEDLAVAQLLITTTAAATGRTDQFYAEAVRVEAQSLAGPWRVEGVAGGVPFRLATGELSAGQTTQVKLSGGGDRTPRFDIDAKVAFPSSQGGVLSPDVTGTAKVFLGPPAQAVAAGLPIPVAVQSNFKTAGREVALEGLSVEAGEGGASLRLGGAGVIRLDEPRLSLRLEGRRIDIDSFILSAAGRDLVSQAGAWAPPPLPFPIDLDLAVASIGLGQEELSNLAFKATLLRGRAVVERAELYAPGQTRIALEGAVGLSTEGGATGRIAVASNASDRFGRYLDKLGLSGPFTALLDGRPLQAAADVVIANPVTSFHHARFSLGEATLTGNVRYTAPEEANRGRLDAQVAVQGLDLEELPQMASLFVSARNLDVGLILDARGLRYRGQAGAGRIAARVLSDGPELVVDTLDISDLAGANASISGRIAPDGSGRIAGKVTASRAAPLVDLVGRVWVGGVSRLVPRFLREGELDLEIVAERAAVSDGTALSLKTTMRGTAAGGLFEADVLSDEGRTERLALRLATDNTGRWVDRPNAPLLRRPSNLDLKGVRVPSGQFNVTVFGDVGGLAIRTTRPFALGSNDDVVDTGEADLNAADVTPFLVLLGDGAGVEMPVPAQLRVALGRERDASLVTLSGRIGDGAVQASLSARSSLDVSGTVNLDRLSLPWLAAAFAFHASPDTQPGLVWPTARFGTTHGIAAGGQVAMKVRRLEFGRGYVGEDAVFNLSLSPDGMAVRDLSTTLASGRLTGFFSIARQGALASLSAEGAIRDAALPDLLGANPFDGRLSATLRFGASGQSIPSLIANLGGTGTLSLTDLQIPNAGPGAIDRALTRALAASDPLASGRLQTMVIEELARAPLQVSSVSIPATLVGGVMRMSPFVADAGSGAWRGNVAFDAKTLTLDARGALSTADIPKGWIGGAPYIALNWRGPVTAPTREVDAGPLVNGVAAVVLQRELERVEAFEADVNERARQSQRRDMDRLRRAAEEAARRAAADAERQGQVRRDQQAEADRLRPVLAPPIGIRPAPPIQTQ
jgi:hypothetical protein